MREDKSLQKKAERLNVTFERLQRKRQLSVASFSSSFLRGDKQEYSASCHSMDTPNIPVLFMSDIGHACPHTHSCWVLVCRSQQKALLVLFPLAWAGLACCWSMDHARDHACWRQPRATTWLIVCRLQSGVGPAARGASWSLQISHLASCINVSLLLSWVVSQGNPEVDPLSWEVEGN